MELIQRGRYFASSTCVTLNW